MTTIQEIRNTKFFVGSWDSAVSNSIDWFWKQHDGSDDEPVLLKYLKYVGCDPVWIDLAGQPYPLAGSDHYSVCNYEDSEDVYLAGITFRREQDRTMFLLKWS